MSCVYSLADENLLTRYSFVIQAIFKTSLAKMASPLEEFFRRHREDFEGLQIVFGTLKLSPAYKMLVGASKSKKFD